MPLGPVYRNRCTPLVLVFVGVALVGLSNQIAGESRTDSAIPGQVEAEIVKIIPPNATTNAQFGSSVAVDANTLVVGAPNDGANFDGSVYVFIRNGGSWEFQAKLLPDGSESASPLYGAAVDVSGDTIVVGIPRARINETNSRGTAYVYIRNGANWTLQQKIVAADGHAGSQLGASVSIEGDTVILGAPGDSAGTTIAKGAAYIFVRNGNVWTQEAKLIDTIGGLNDNFGGSVGLSNNSVIVGAIFGDNQFGASPGSASIFTRQNTSWTLQGRLFASDAADSDWFGASVDIDGDHAIVGAPQNVPSPGAGHVGSAYLFSRTGGTWTEQQKLPGASSNGILSFGGTVAISGSRAIVGESRATIRGLSLAGAASVFTRSGTVWNLQNRLTASDAAVANRFGSSVAIQNNRFFAGAPSAGVGTTNLSGSVYFFIESPRPPDLQQASDSGTSSSDDITNQINLSFDIGGITQGATVELLRSGQTVASVSNSGTSTVLVDSVVPTDGTFQYTTRQTVAGEISSASEPLTVTVDTAGPVVAVNQYQFQIDPTAQPFVTFQATFNEPVVGFASDDVSLAASTANVSNATITISNEPAPNLISINNIVSDGQFVRADIPAGRLQDLAGNPNPTSSSQDNTVTVDNVRPSVTINQAPGQADPVAVLPLRYQVIFSEPVTGFGPEDLSFIGSTANMTGRQVTVTGSGAIYEVSIGNITSNGQFVRATVNVGAQDALGNPNLLSTSVDNTITLDNVRPTVTLNQAVGQVDPARSQPVVFTAQFNEVVSGFTPSDIQFTGSTADISQAVVIITGGPTAYTVAVSNVRSSGTLRVTLLSGAADDWLGNPSLASTSTDNTVTILLKASAFDFDGDGKADIAVRRPSDNTWYLLRTTAGYTAMAFGIPGDQMAPADYDGDGKTDVAVFRPSENRWYIHGSTAGFYDVTWGTTGDIPVPADYDGDGKSDVAIYRPSTGTWYIVGSSAGLIVVNFGTAEDKPYPADYDGDGKADIVVRRPSDNNWYLLRTTAGYTVVAWGINGDQSAPADYDGDGKTDLAVFRPSDNTWYIFGSQRGIYTQTWGTTGDVTVPADFDGDGKADIAVFRPSNGTWYIIGSTAGIIITTFGQNGDTAVPSVFNY